MEPQTAAAAAHRTLTHRQRTPRLRAPLYLRTTTMPAPAHLPCSAQPYPRLLARTRPVDALLKRRRSVLFAFTFSPPAWRH